MKSALALIHNIRKKDRPKRNGYSLKGFQAIERTSMRHQLMMVKVPTREIPQKVNRHVD